MHFLLLFLPIPFFAFNIQIAHSPEDVDQVQGQAVLVRSFLTQYEDVPLTDIGDNLHSINDVCRYYEDYFVSEFDHFKKGELIWVQAFEDNQILGWATFELEPGGAYMNLLAVDPTAQKKGIGKTLTFSILKEHPEVNEIRLLLRKLNERGRKFYEHIGFKNFVYYRDDNFIDITPLTGLKWTKS